MGLKKGISFRFVSLKMGVRVQQPSRHTPIQNLREYPPLPGTTATKFSFYIVSRYLATGQSEIVLGKTHPIVLKARLHGEFQPGLKFQPG